MRQYSPFSPITEGLPFSRGCYGARDEYARVCDSEAVYHPRNPEDNPLYGVVSEHLETFLERQLERE